MSYSVMRYSVMSYYSIWGASPFSTTASALCLYRSSLQQPPQTTHAVAGSSAKECAPTKCISAHVS